MPFIVRCCFFTCFVSLRSQVVIDGNCYFDISLPCLSLFLCTTFVFVASISMTSVSPPGISFIPESECKVNTFFRTGKTFRKIFCGIFTLPHATLRKSTPYDRIFFSAFSTHLRQCSISGGTVIYNYGETKAAEDHLDRFWIFQILEFCILWCAWEWNHVANVCHTCNKKQQTLET